MKTNFIKNSYFRSSLFVVAGIIVGWLLFHSSSNVKSSPNQTVKEAKKTIWTCAMHPQIRMDHPGKCPICGMDLIPLDQETASIDPDAIVMTDEAVKLAEVQTSIVSREKPVKELRLYGKIQADERLVQTQPAHVPGRIEKLLVDFTGQDVHKGETIARIYSPELVTAQQELLEALKMKELQPQILDAAREKLRQWKFSDSQITDIEKSGTVKTVFNVDATVSGIVITKRVNVGDYVQQGAPLYEIADLSHVWALFDAYESDLPWIKTGDRISFTVESQPGKKFAGTVSFIDPVINPQTRVARVRVEVSNPRGELKPEMFITGIAEAKLSTSGKSLVIPQSAVLWTGTRSVVYVKVLGAAEPSFKMREITLGPALNNSYVVLDGLKEGEEIVTNGTFSVDAAAQLAGKPSMMNTEGGTTSAMPGMNMGNGDAKTKSTAKNDKVYIKNGKLDIDPEFKKQLTLVYTTYLPMKDAFVKSDPQEVAQLAQKVSQSLKGVNMELLEGETHMVWMKLLDKLNKSLGTMENNHDIKLQREAFGAFNLAFYQAVKDFGLEGVTTYYQYCPMAFDQKGAYWFSEVKKIENPYFGDEMITCGETSETLKY